MNDPAADVAARGLAPQQAATRVCDLLVLSWNRGDLLVPCVERILRHTDVPSRLWVVDNASDDPETAVYLDRLSRQNTDGPVEVAVVRRARNEGFAIGMNDGLSRTQAPWICLLNHDVLVTEGWLSEMIRVAEANPQIGLLNPMSNEFNAGPMEPGPAIDEVARRLKARRGRWLENWLGVGFCVLLSRRVFERVGTLDEQFQPMYAEDADYSLRVRQAGWICAIAEGAYVFHHQRSAIKRDPSLLKRMEDNQQRFYRKWQREPHRRIACVLTGRREEPPAVVAERIRRLANQGHRVWVFHVRADDACVPRHFQVTPQRLSGLAPSAQAVGRLLAKKKGFHRLLVSTGRMERWLRRLGRFHRAEVRRLDARGGPG